MRDIGCPRSARPVWYVITVFDENWNPIPQLCHGAASVVGVKNTIDEFNREMVRRLDGNQFELSNWGNAFGMEIEVYNG